MTQHVLITGGCGFIGRHLTEELLDHGYRVRILDSMIEQVHGSAEAPQEERVETVVGDVRDAKLVRAALAEIDMVVHLAAEVGVGQSMYEIARYVSANELGTAVLLEEIAQTPVERIVVASSMSVYGEGHYQDSEGSRVSSARRSTATMGPCAWDPVDALGQALTPVATDEEKPVDLASVYALTKFVQERAVLIFAKAYRRDAVALRLFNVFGPGQALSNPYTGVLANFASRLVAGERPMIFEDGRQRRDFVHVRDVARAFRLALEKPQATGHVINIGSGVSWSIADVARLLAEAMGVPDIKPDIIEKARAGDIRNCFADISKAREMLGFRPQHRLEDTLDELVAWVREAGGVDRALEMRRQLESRGLMT